MKNDLLYSTSGFGASYLLPCAIMDCTNKTARVMQTRWCVPVTCMLADNFLLELESVVQLVYSPCVCRLDYVLHTVPRVSGKYALYYWKYRDEQRCVTCTAEVQRFDHLLFHVNGNSCVCWRHLAAALAFPSDTNDILRTAAGSGSDK